MPHSVSSQEQEIAMEPESNIESQASEMTLIAEDEDTQSEDIALADGEVLQGKLATKTEETSEVKLEDLFADMDSDEEFPSSAPAMKVEGSPEEPPSPV